MKDRICRNCKEFSPRSPKSPFGKCPWSTGEIKDDTRGCQKFQETSIQDIAEAIRELLNDPEERPEAKKLLEEILEKLEERE